MFNYIQFGFEKLESGGIQGWSCKSQHFSKGSSVVTGHSSKCENLNGFVEASRVSFYTQCCGLVLKRHTLSVQSKWLENLNRQTLEQLRIVNVCWGTITYQKMKRATWNSGISFRIVMRYAVQYIIKIQVTILWSEFQHPTLPITIITRTLFTRPLTIFLAVSNHRHKLPNMMKMIYSTGF